MLNARGPELSGYGLRETSGGWGLQAAPNRKAGCRGWSRSVAMTVRSVRRHVPLYVSICNAALLRPTLSRSAYATTALSPSPLAPICSLGPLWHAGVIATAQKPCVLGKALRDAEGPGLEPFSTRWPTWTSIPTAFANVFSQTIFTGSLGPAID